MFKAHGPDYFTYMANAFYNDLPTVMCKILGIFSVVSENFEDKRRGINQHVVVMENLFYHRHVTKIFDLKGLSRNRYVEVKGQPLTAFDNLLLGRRQARQRGEEETYVAPGHNSDEQGVVVGLQVLLDDNLSSSPEAGLPSQAPRKGVF